MKYLQISTFSSLILVYKCGHKKSNNHAGGISYPQLEREYGVNRSTISGWVMQLSSVKVSDKEYVTLKEYKALQKENQRLKIENEILKKRDCHIRKTTITEIVTFLQESLNTYTIFQLCSALKFPGSTYYKTLVHVPGERQQAYETSAVR